MAEQRKYRKFTAEQKAEIVLAGLRGDRSVREVCREHEIAETLYYQWREKLLEGGQAALAGHVSSSARVASRNPNTSRISTRCRLIARAASQ